MIKSLLSQKRQASYASVLGKDRELDVLEMRAVRR